MSAAWVGFLGSVVVAVLTLVGVLVSNSKARAVKDAQIQSELALVKNEMASLRQEVQKHNGLIERTYKLEERVSILEHEQKAG